MSKISDPAPADPMPWMDRRARRTRELLAEALMTLGAAHEVDDIEVGGLAAAAGVGRSTFYTHYASKDDFLVASFVNLLGMSEAAMAKHDPDRTDLLPARPLFQHIYEAQDFARAIVRSRAFARQMAAGEAKLRAIAEANLARLKPQWPLERRRETAVFVAAGFIGLLRWWMEGGVRHEPARMRAAFERLSACALQD
jgi:AcrR family transcriptional regulator